MSTARAEMTPTVGAMLTDYPIRPVPFTAVHIHDDFWSPRIEVNRTVTIPYAFKQCEETGRVALFERAAAVLRGEKNVDRSPPGFPFDDTDVYKVLEGASYSLAVHADPKLDAYLDSLIVKIAAAQEPDGYLYCTRTINPEHPHLWSGHERWVNEEASSHELYNLGHLYEAAVAHYQATGKRTLLNVALKSADLLDRTFGPGKRSIWPGHQIVEMGLVKLTRVTGDDRYLKLAKFFLDQRGTDGSKGNPYNQSWMPVTQQSIATGHAVRAVYMYSGMADVAALTGDQTYLHAIDRIWENVVSDKYYITGGIGARHAGESFGDNFELPNRTAYNETCAAIGNDYWNQRLFLLHGEAKYIDVLERTLYNSLLGGVSLDGMSFFYPNPLESHGDDSRSHWFGCACCPGNMTRFLASVPGYLYAQRDSTIYTNLYASSDAEMTLPTGTAVKLTQTTNYPWDGDVKVAVAPATPERFTLALRIPGWAQNQPVPSSLYRFLDKQEEAVTLSVNGESLPLTVKDGYASITREWKAGDAVKLNLPMPIRRVVAAEQVATDANCVALQRGPIVYCLEWPDNPEGRTLNLSLADDATVSAKFRKDLLGGVIVLKGAAISSAVEADNSIAKTPVALTAIPYSVWANRGNGEMNVWIPRESQLATPIPKPSLLTTATLATSTGGTPRPNTRIDLGGLPGSTQSVEVRFAQPSAISSVEVRWYDDGERASIRFPKSWRLSYKDGDDWKPVVSSKPLTIPSGKGRGLSGAKFASLTTTALKIEVDAQPNFAASIESMRVW